jgi:hypothetical protein
MLRRLLGSLRAAARAMPSETGHVHAGAVGALSVCHDPDCRAARRR